MRRAVLIGLLIASVAPAVSAASAGAAELVVTRTDDPVPDGCDPGDCSLREAVVDSNAGDTIRLEAKTYLLSQPPPFEDFGFPQVGDLDLTHDLRIAGPPGRARARIHGGGDDNEDRVFEVRGSGTEVSFTRLDISGGQAQRTFDDTGDGEPDFAQGGGVYVGAGARLSARDVGLVGNVALAFGQGGGIFNAGELSLVDSSVRLNVATGGFGGGIQTEPGATTTIFDSSVYDNAASFGGGVHALGIVTAERSAIYGNEAALGGGIRAAAGAVVSLTNLTLAHNEVGGHGGGAYVVGGAGVVANGVTIAFNRADGDDDGAGDGGGIFVRDDATEVSLRNSILAANEDSNVFGPGGTSNVGDCRVEDGAALKLLGYDLLGDTGGCNHAVPIGAEGNQIGTPFNPVEPLLGEQLLDAPGQGKTPTLPLARRSPAVNAGSPAAPGSAADACPATDQRGVERKRCDIGAYELVRCRGRIALYVGTPGRDVLRGTAGKDGLIGFAGRDKLRGRGGKDALCGGQKNDRLSGGPGRDKLDGGRGRDRCRGGSGKDKLRRCEVKR